MTDRTPTVPVSAGASEAVRLFDREAARYDAWFDSPEGRVLFSAEVAAVRRLVNGLPGPVLEVGVGTGRFAQALGVPYVCLRAEVAGRKDLPIPRHR